MAGNMCSIVALNESLTKRGYTPETKSQRFHDTNYTNKDVVCPRCHVHQHRKAGGHKECLFCGSDLEIKRGRKRKIIID